MLNISHNTIQGKVDPKDYKALEKVENKKSSRVLKTLLKWTSLICIIILFLPWSQNVRSKGNISTLKPNQRPQTINTIISGKIEKWYVQEGQQVKKGDTIVVISEVKDKFLDQQLLERTKNQLDLKKQSVDAYGQKENAQDRQLEAIKNQFELYQKEIRIKIQQTQRKVQNDSIAYEAAEINSSTAKERYDRIDSLYQLGLKSLIDLESRNLKLQEARSKALKAKNEWINNKNELTRLRLELLGVATKYETDRAKILSEKLTTSSSKYDAQSTVNKIANEFSNYTLRSGYYVITAPADAYITQVFYAGTGEIIKEGEKIVSMMPTAYQLAIEIYVDPIDIPLMHEGEKLRVQFDGWPAIVFSGWPNVSYGTYGGEIYAIDQFISPNGKYRLLVKPDEEDHEWPQALRFGAGANAMIILNDVPIWYELWRNINGFPPDYYLPIETEKK